MTKEKDQSIVWLRAIACIMVVIIHGSMMVPTHQGKLLKIFAIFFVASSFIAVPIFAMITGYLLFGQKGVSYEGLLFSRFWKIFHLIIYFEIIYYIGDTVVGRGNYPFWHSIFDQTHGPFWYLKSILATYLLTAFITLPQDGSKKFYITLFLALAGLFFLTNSISEYPFKVNNPAYKGSQFFLFLYTLVGFVLGKLGKIRHTWFFFTIYIIFSLGISYFTLKRGLTLPNETYRSIGTFFHSVAFFLFIRGLDIAKIAESTVGKPINAFLSFLSTYSLGVYGWHWIVAINVSFFLTNKVSPWEPRLYQVLILVWVLTVAIALLISIFDTWFWKKFRQLFQPLGERFLGLVKSIKMGYNISK